MPPEAVKQPPARNEPARGEPARHEPATEPDPYDEPVAYLRSKGWRCLGSTKGAGWLDPTCPPVPTCRKVKVQARNWKTGALEDVIADNGGGARQVVEQVVYDSPAEPMAMQQALQIQIERDRKAMARTA